MLYFFLFERLNSREKKKTKQLTKSNGTLLSCYKDKWKKTFKVGGGRRAKVAKKQINNFL